MWILVVLSAVYGTDEVRMTYYDAYQTSQQCSIQQAVLTSTFKDNEVAVCVTHKDL